MPNALTYTISHYSLLSYDPDATIQQSTAIFSVMKYIDENSVMLFL